MLICFENDCPRFETGINYPWEEFAQDIGGVQEWGKLPLHQDPTKQQAFRDGFCDLAAHCVEYARVWMFPELWTSDFNYDANGCPTGNNGNSTQDVVTLLSIAKECGIKLQLTFFSFDNFKRRGDAAGCNNGSVTGTFPSSYGNLQRIYLAGCMQQVCDHIVRPIVQAAEASQFSDCIHSWDVFNEPTQITNDAVSHIPLAQQYAGSAIFLGAGQGFTPQDPACFYSLNITQMRDLVGSLISCVKSVAGVSPVTVGVDAKWAYAYAGLGQDYHSIHIYCWGEPYFPTRPNGPEWFVNDGLPGQIGEHPSPCAPDNASVPPLDVMCSGPAPAVPASTVAFDYSSWCDSGWFSAASWSYKVDNQGIGTCLDELLAWSEDYLKTPDAIEVSPATINCNGGSVVVTAAVVNQCGHPMGEATTPPDPIPHSTGWVYDEANCRYTTTVTPDASCTPQTVQVQATFGDDVVFGDVRYTDGECNEVEICVQTGDCTEVEICVQTGCTEVEICVQTAEKDLPNALLGHGCFTVKTCERVACGRLTSCAKDCTVCCDPHRSGMYWCDLCRVPCWTTTAIAAAGAENVENACSCVRGARWRFTPQNCRARWEVATSDGCPRPFDCIVIWGHNLTRFGGAVMSVYGDGQLLSPYNYTDPEVVLLPELNHDGSEYQRPIVWCLEESIMVESVAIEFLLPRDVEYCIESIAAMQFAEFPNGLQPGWVNPAIAGDYTIRFKDGDTCGQLEPDCEYNARDFDISTVGVDDCWLRETFMPIRRWAKNNDVYFAWSTNRYPEELIRGRLTEASYTHTRLKGNLQMSIRGYTEQQQK